MNTSCKVSNNSNDSNNHFENETSSRTNKNFKYKFNYL